MKERAGVLRSEMSVSRKRARAVEHQGVEVVRGTIELACCDGAPNSERRNREVVGYSVHGALGNGIDMCRHCAVKLAMEILEAEVG